MRIELKSTPQQHENNSGLNLLKSDSFTSFEELSGTFDDRTLPWLDRKILFRRLDEMSKFWRENGYLVVKDLIDHQLLDNYCNDWIQHNQINHNRRGGYPGPCPYMVVDSLMELATCSPLQQITRQLIGEEMGIHLALTGWKSTERNWHQDGYLNPDHNQDHYIAVWIALDDIHPDSGPFEYIRGSHKLPKITNQKTLERIPEELRDEHWPKRSEQFLTPLFESLIQENNLKRRQFIARKGDVLFWHARLMHRGTEPVNPLLNRKTAILHYSGIHHRPDFPSAKQYKQQGWYFPIATEMAL